MANFGREQTRLTGAGTSFREHNTVGNMLRTCTLTTKKGTPGKHLKNELQNHLMLVNRELACKSTFCDYAVKMDSEQDATSASSLPRRSEVTRSAHRRQQVRAVDNHFPTMNNRFAQWMTICSAEIRWFVPWVTTCFLNHRSARGPR